VGRKVLLLYRWRDREVVRSGVRSSQHAEFPKADRPSTGRDAVREAPKSLLLVARRCCCLLAAWCVRVVGVVVVLVVLV